MVTILKVPQSTTCICYLLFIILLMHDLDIAISAPFGEGSGTVYIYIGRRGNQLIQCTPEQVNKCILQ